MNAQKITLPISNVSAVMIFATMFCVAINTNCLSQVDVQNKTQVAVVLPVGHTEYVKSCEFSSDGRFILTASLDKNIILWDVKTGYELKRYQGSPLGVMKAVFSPDNRYIASVGWDLKIRLWNLETAALINTFGEGMNCVIFSKDGSKLYADSRDGRVGIYNSASGEKTGEIKAHTGIINDMSVSPDGSRLFTVSADGSCKVWALPAMKLIHTFSIEKGGIQDAVCGKSGLIAYGCSDGVVKLCNSDNFSQIREFKAHEASVVDIDFSADGKLLSTTGWDGKLKIWDTFSAELISSVDAHKFLVYDAAFSPVGKYIATCGTDKDVKLWDVESGTLLRYYTGHTTKVASIDADTDEKVMVAGLWDQIRFDDNRPVFWNLGNGSLEASGGSHSFMLNAVALSAETEIAASVAEDTRVMLWNTHNGSLINENRIPQGGLKDVCFYNTEQKIAVACTDKTVRVLTQQGMELYQVLPCENKDPSCVDVDKNDRLLAAGFTDGTVMVWNAETGKLITEFAAHKDPVYDIKFSPGSDHLVTASYDKTAVVWSLPDFKKVSEFKGHEWIVSSIAIAGDGTIVFTGSWDRQVCQWNMFTGELIRKYSGHSNYVSGITLSSNGKQLFSCSWDGSIIAWDTQTGKKICTFISVDDNDWLVVTPDNFYMGSKDAARKVSFTSGMNSFGFEQFDLQYNRPDKVLEQLPWADSALIPVYRKAYEKRLIKSGVNESWFGPDFHSPEIRILNRSEISLITENNAIELHLILSDSVYKINTLNLWVNGVPYYGVSGKSVEGIADLKNYRVTIPLSYGKNRIEAACMNEKGVFSLKDEIEIYQETNNPRKPDLYLISLAVSEFDDSRYNLKYTVQDGRSFIKCFSPPNDRFGHVYIDSLYNENCTRENLRNIRQKLMNTHVDDEVIVHVAGHGLLDDKQDFYFAVSNINFKNPSVNGINYAEIESLLDSIPARNKLLLLDACHSGEVDEASEMAPVLTDNARTRGVVMYKLPVSELSTNDINLKNSFDLMREIFVDVRRSTGAVVISAASGAGFAIEREDLQNGIFTYCIVEAIEDLRADKNNDGSISVSELRDFVIKRVREISDGQQFPTSRKENLINDFRVW
ncbi:MAG: caspase family protein [Bacteroidales bacterium]|nr:caspase family protein [Bacteroidales bacterium]